jgi:hypothetical protein
MAHLSLGHDTPFPVSDHYAPPFAWNGVIHEMNIKVPDRAASTRGGSIQPGDRPPLVDWKEIREEMQRD